MSAKKIMVVTILGARPQFIKAAPVSALISKKYQGKVQEIIVHTGQHYDRNMSDIFFRQMRIPRPRYHLGVGGGSHGAMTGIMMEKIERVLLRERPDWVMVYGDTNSTLAGALAAAKLHIPVAHVEAGLRSFNMRMPEEINRILTDRISTLLFCPTPTAAKNLKNEGITKGVHLTGDVMFDAARFFLASAGKIPLQNWGLKDHGYAFCTVHRQENTDNLKNLRQILKALCKISQTTTVVFAAHPRTRKVICQNRGLKKMLRMGHPELGMQKAKKKRAGNKGTGIMVLDPLGYLETQRLLMGARAVLTDSGGLQKEAFFHRVPCVTLRDETEWVETVDAGWNQLVGAEAERIFRAFQTAAPGTPIDEYGGGLAARRIASIIEENIS